LRKKVDVEIEIEMKKMYQKNHWLHHFFVAGLVWVGSGQQEQRVGPMWIQPSSYRLPFLVFHFLLLLLLLHHFGHNVVLQLLQEKRSMFQKMKMMSRSYQLKRLTEPWKQHLLQ
jgi:hypothetical protein